MMQLFIVQKTKHQVVSFREAERNFTLIFTFFYFIVTKFRKSVKREKQLCNYNPV